MSVNILELAWSILRRLTNDVSTRTLYLILNERTGIVGKDSSGYGYDADYQGVRGDEKWTGTSILLEDDFIDVPAAPFNFSADFSFSCWVRSNEADFTLLSCRRHEDVALEITNKRVTINGTTYTYA